MITIAICILGSFNFALHFAIWTGKRREIYRNIETLSFLITFSIAFWMVSTALLQQGLYPATIALFRKAFFQVASAHTGTGLMTVYAPQFLGQWFQLAAAGLIMAMLIGAGAGSTAGGFKGLRMGILFKALVEDIKRLTVSEGVYIRDHIHHIRDIPLSDRLVRNAALVVLSYLVLFGMGTAGIVFCGYSLPEALFESASATGNVGLTCGITAPNMPTLLKVIFIFQMWAARLEFTAVFVLIGFLWGGLFGVRGGRRGAALQQ